MMRTALLVGLAATALALGGCGSGSESENAAAEAQPDAAREAAGDKTIAAGLNQNGRFFQAAQAAGLDATLSGPGPYTVLVPADAAFAKLPAASTENWTRPEGRAELTGVLTYHILPGTVLASDIGKAIDNAKGTATLATMGGATLTATKQGETIVLADAAGNKANVTQSDQRFTNGVVHHIDAVLMPGERGAGGSEASTPAPGATPSGQ